jgi:hypothetical protein
MKQLMTIAILLAAVAPASADKTVTATFAYRSNQSNNQTSPKPSFTQNELTGTTKITVSGSTMIFVWTPRNGQACQLTATVRTSGTAFDFNPNQSCSAANGQLVATSVLTRGSGTVTPQGFHWTMEWSYSGQYGTSKIAGTLTESVVATGAKQTAGR